jgi:glycosyltransferase involved in cell wall biosynthesis
MAQALQACGVQVTIVTTDDDGPGCRSEVSTGRLIRDGYGVDWIWFRKQSEFYKYSSSLGRWLRLHVGEFDLVHIHALFSYSSVAAAKAAYRAGVPYVVRPLGVLNQWGMQNRRRALKRLSMRWIERTILRRAAAIHFTSERERSEALTADPVVGSARAAVIPLPIELPDKREADAELFLDKYPQARRRDLILFLSRIDQKKGVELLVHAFAEVRRTRATALLVIAGDGDAAYRKVLENLAERLGVSEAMIWTGFVGGREKAAALAAASIFVLPSYSENFGIAAAEAMAAGLATIVCEGVAIAEYAKDRGAAVVVKPDASAIARSVERLLADPELQAIVAESGRALVKECFSLSSVGRELRDLYDSIIGRESLVNQEG